MDILDVKLFGAYNNSKDIKNIFLLSTRCNSEGNYKRFTENKMDILDVKLFGAYNNSKDIKNIFLLSTRCLSSA